MIEYKVRETKTFANYRITALKLEKLYGDFDHEMNGELKNQINKEIIANLDTYKQYAERIKETEDAEKVGLEFSDKLSNLFTLNQKLVNDTLITKEIFLLNDNKKYAKELCSIYFENCDFNHDKEMNDDEYTEYIEWLLEAFNGFFLKVKRSKIIN